MKRYILELWRLTQTNPFPIARWDFASADQAIDHCHGTDSCIRSQGLYYTLRDSTEGKRINLKGRHAETTETIRQ